jgi:hypothetical protein
VWRSCVSEAMGFSPVDLLMKCIWIQAEPLCSDTSKKAHGRMSTQISPVVPCLQVVSAGDGEPTGHARAGLPGRF